MKLVFLLLFFSFCSCNTKHDTNSEKANNSVSIGHDTLSEKVNKPDSIGQKNFYNLKSFMSFNSTTTIKILTAFLERKKITFLINPDCNSIPSSQHDNVYFWDDCPYAQFIYVPELKLEEFNFKEVLFIFINNYLSFIMIDETFNDVSEDNSKGDLFKLRSYYVKKYGNLTPEVHISEDRTVKYWTYENQNDSISVVFGDTYIAGSDILINSTDLLIHSFIMTFHGGGEKCHEYFAKEKEKRERKKKEKEKKILDQL